MLYIILLYFTFKLAIYQDDVKCMLI